MGQKLSLCRLSLATVQTAGGADGAGTYSSGELIQVIYFGL